MNMLLYLIPAALALGAIGVAGFLWALHSGQFDDLEGAGERIFLDDDESLPTGDLGRQSARDDDRRRGAGFKN